MSLRFHTFSDEIPELQQHVLPTDSPLQIMLENIPTLCGPGVGAVLQLQQAKKPPRGLTAMQSRGPCPSSGGWGPGICISAKFPGDSNLTGPGTPR